MRNNIKRGEQIQIDILRVLKESERPVSTSDIAEETKRAWHSVDRHCLKLQVEGKIEGFKIGNINVWQVKK